ncbi:PE family protein [Mycobacterium intermedium]|uniref:PE family protein n=1 Tax=Mycobacterium intermedium TaxID=28445 RepID=A0A1E3SF75_MYCIE|nr:PE family protein [Mycobacterium intermedium]MCV6966667.1 PE family protein [Mycobacterium intermedium]ODR00816.1 hypothetical protein BHQ20_11540 [Mycobacterium intermedium]OPE52135.1 PE family protein [Mycobacterium intermedium]ORB10577.1 PE family protein [Mycobacterium intermedium]
MPDLNVTPQLLAAAANDLSAIAATMNGANAAAAAPTSDLTAAGGDPVSAYIAALFNYHAATYQAVGAQAATFHDQFVQLMRSGAGSYAATEAANVSPMQDAFGAVKAAAESPTGRSLIDGAKGAVGTGRETAERMLADGKTTGAAPVGSTSYGGSSGGAGAGGLGADGGAGNGVAAGGGSAVHAGGGDVGGGGTSGGGGSSASVGSNGAPSEVGSINFMTAGGGAAGWVADPNFAAGGPSAAATVPVVPATPFGGDVGGSGVLNPGGLFGGAAGGVGHGAGHAGDAAAGATFAGTNGEYAPIAGLTAPVAPAAPSAAQAPTTHTTASAAAEQSLAKPPPLQLNDPAHPNLARADTSVHAAQHAAQHATPVQDDKALLVIPLPSLRTLREKIKKLTELRTSELYGESEFRNPTREDAFRQLSPRDQLLQALGIRPPDLG